MRVVWIGCVTFVVPEDQHDAVQRALAPFRCVPLFLPHELLRDFYNGYCKGTLWQIFHNVIDVYGPRLTRWMDRAGQERQWRAYTDVNRRFAAKVVEVWSQGDLVWVHDFHLMLVPSFLARMVKEANIGLFLHTPFPSSEIFRTLSVREDILHGMHGGTHICERPSGLR